ncbi:DUF115 domain-containing protein [Roseospira marina]|uniref:DUF115 domain-containing protein n=1 Tax=Roseospira marina TaxID=140057 RepID=A0A5M6I6V8_9PROT|nr:6-hydroxymethylpterin diphosphokinase MptE-like protein [Roseospira marina]KAA5603832.1 DUF115 domain-containing protein [Roseospira marina]MBB4313781.1 hypothetical protein [Roseospira marina]MBB5086943.1 hypothetical protein [Roseospira marina]
MHAELTQEPYTNPALYDRNVALLARRAPAIQSFLESGRCDYTLQEAEGGVVILDSRGERVLPLPEPQYSNQRFAVFERRAIVLTAFRPLINVNLDAHCWADHLQSVLPVTDQAFWRRVPDMKGAMTAVVVDHASTEGMKALIDCLPDLDILVYCISDINLFIAALHLMDWSEIYKTCEKRNAELWIRLLPQGREAVREVLQHIRRAARMLPDNIPVYLHKESAASTDFGRSLIEEFATSTFGVGFFRDEVIMLENSMVNILDHKRPLLRRQRAHAGTALVVGSGPSLDQSFETIRALSESCLVVACGSAVEPLLSQGIRVDVCVILERGQMVKTVFDGIASRVDLSSVVMVASSTINDQIEEHFARGVYFFRPGLNVAEGFGRGKHHVVQGCDPTVSNTGLSVAEYMGFRRMLLFGVDVGSLDQNKHHSDHTPYYVDKALKDQKILDFPTKTTGSFGGPAHTTWVFEWTRARIEDFATVFDHLFILNVSDGVVIPSVTPVMPVNGALLTRVFPVGRPAEPPVTVEADPFDEDHYNYDPDECDRYMNAIAGACADLSWKTRQSVVMSLNNLLWTREASHPYQRLVRGSVTQMVASVFGVLMRMDDEQRRTHEPALRAAVLKGVEAMHTELSDLLRHGIHAIPADDPARG